MLDGVQGSHTQEEYSSNGDIGSVLASIASNKINYGNLSVALACSNGIWYGRSWKNNEYKITPG